MSLRMLAGIVARTRRFAYPAALCARLQPALSDLGVAAFIANALDTDNLSVLSQALAAVRLVRCRPPPIPAHI